MYVTVIIQHDNPESCMEANHMTAYLDKRLDMVTVFTVAEDGLSEELVAKIKRVIEHKEQEQS